MRFILLALVTLLISCGSPSSTSKSASISDTLYHCQYAKRFKLFRNGDTTLLQVLNPWQGAKDITMEYRFTTPFKRIVCMSSSHVAFLDAVGGFDNIIGASGLKFIFNPLVKTSQIVDVGYDNNLNYEAIVALKPDVVLVYEVSGEGSTAIAKLRQLGVPVIYIADYLENSPLGRAEWIVAFGALIGKEVQAAEFFEDIANSYNATKSKVQTANSIENSPKIMLNSPYRDVWYVPGDRSYIVKLINDAGGRYLAAGVDDDISRPISTEVAYQLMNQADLWLNPSQAQTLDEVIQANHRFAKLPVVSQGRVYNNNARGTEDGGSDFWESGSVRADLVLMDLAKICHPLLFPEHEFYYFHCLK